MRLPVSVLSGAWSPATRGGGLGRSRVCRCIPLADPRQPRPLSTRRMSVELEQPSLPVSEALSESLCLRHDHRHVGELDLAPSLSRLCRHQLLDSPQNLFLHREDFGVDVGPVACLLQGCASRRALPVHSLRPITAANSGVDVGPRRALSRLLHAFLCTALRITRSATAHRGLF